MRGRSGQPASHRGRWDVALRDWLVCSVRPSSLSPIKALSMALWGAHRHGASTHSWAVELHCDFAEQPGYIAGERAPHFDVKRIFAGSPQHDVGFREYGASAHACGKLT